MNTDEHEFRIAARQLAEIFKNLCELEPKNDKYDVIWDGPYYIERPGVWRESSFMLYQGVLYFTVEIGGARASTLAWKIGSEEASIERGLGFSTSQYVPWVKVLEQIGRKIVSAQKNLPAYNRRIQRQLPLTCRYGRIQRNHTWPKDFKLPVEETVLRALEEYGKKEQEGYAEMTRDAYLGTAAIAYEAAFEDLKELDPYGKYKRRADGRHGGLLELPPDDPQAFSAWFNAGDWHGSHPWEIVFGHPHGIMLAPHQDEKSGRWLYNLWAGSEGSYIMLVKMATALMERGIRFGIYSQDEVFKALRGTDEVKVTPEYSWGSVQYTDIKELRPEMLKTIEWERTPELAPITPAGRERIAKARNAQN